MGVSMTQGEVIGIVTAVVALLYLLPSFLAVARRRPRAGLIFALNLFLGWSIVGWIVAYRLAVADDEAEPRRHRSRKRRALP